MGACSSKAVAREDENGFVSDKNKTESSSPDTRESVETPVESIPTNGVKDGKISSKKPLDAESIDVSSTRRRRLSVIPLKTVPDRSEVLTSSGLRIEEVINELGERMLFPVGMESHPLIHSIMAISVPGMEPGYDKTNQDFITIHPLAAAPGNSDQSFIFGVFDGHGVEGHHVSKKVSGRIVKAVSEAGQITDKAGHLWDTFRSVNTDLVTDGEIDCTFSGATATVSILDESRLTSAWVGDSRAVLGRREGTNIQAYDLTTDHKPDIPEETARIESSGGRVETLLDDNDQPVGPPRVWLANRWAPGLAMSRSLGDTLAASCGVSSSPDVSIVDLTPADICLIWASDGVWEFISSQEAVDVVVGYENAAEAAVALARLAQEHWRTNEVSVSDDISCVVVMLNGGQDSSPVAPIGEGSSPVIAGKKIEEVKNM